MSIPRTILMIRCLLKSLLQVPCGKAVTRGLPTEMMRNYFSSRLLTKAFYYNSVTQVVLLKRTNGDVSYVGSMWSRGTTFSPEPQARHSLVSLPPWPSSPRTLPPISRPKPPMVSPRSSLTQKLILRTNHVIEVRGLKVKVVVMKILE